MVLKTARTVMMRELLPVLGVVDSCTRLVEFEEDGWWIVEMKLADWRGVVFSELVGVPRKSPVNKGEKSDMCCQN